MFYFLSGSVSSSILACHDLGVSSGTLAVAASTQIAVLETKLSSAPSAEAATEGDTAGEQPAADGHAQREGSDENAEITPAATSTAAAPVDAVEEEEEGEKDQSKPEQRQEVLALETRLQEAESLVSESKQAAREAEAVVAALREEQVSGGLDSAAAAHI